MWPLLLLTALLLSTAELRASDIRIGIIGCDTSHAIAFTENLNNPEAKGHVSGGKVVAAFKGGSPDIPASANRVEGYSKTLKEKHGVKFYESIAEMCRDVDAVMLESVDGRPHLEQAKEVFKVAKASAPAEAKRKPGVGARSSTWPKAMFIDKPMAASLKDISEIFRLARESGVPVFSASALRFGKDTQQVRNGSIGKVTYAETYGPCEIEPHHPDLFWYGIHGVEALFTVMGPDWRTVMRQRTPEGKIEVVGIWSDGRKGVYREEKNFHGSAKGERGETSIGSFDGYEPLLAEIMKFFQTGVPPVKPEETLAMFNFMVTADGGSGVLNAPKAREEH